MPALKSPAQALKLWKKGAADYLKVNKIKELEPQEDFLNKKVVKGLDRLKVAALKKDQIAPDDFNGMRDDTLIWMDKFRKLFKPKKDKAPVKLFYQKVCRLVLVVQKLALKELDADESDLPDDVLNDLNPDALDDSEAEGEQDDSGGVPAAPPPPPPPSPARAAGGKPVSPLKPPAEDLESGAAAAFTARLKGLLPRVLEAQKASAEPVKVRLNNRVSEARTFARKEDYEAAHDGLDAVEDLVNEVLGQRGSTRPDSPAPPPAPAPEAPPETTAEWKKRIDLSKCQTQNLLGQGGRGTVYLVQSSDPNCPPLVFKNSDQEEMEREAEFYAKAGDHPNIAKCLGLAKVIGPWGYPVQGVILEAIKGKDMEKARHDLQRRYQAGELSHEEYWGAMQFGLAHTLEALAHLESKGVVHLDIKPDNVMWDQTTGDVKLLDFGTAINVGDELNAGTPNFMGPGSRTGPSADLFAAGATAYNLAEGQRFEFNRPNGINLDQARDLFAAPDADGSAKTALLPETDNDPASAVDKQSGVHTKKVGHTASATAYTEFVNWLMHPDPAKRPTATEALKHPFMQQRMLGDEDAKELMKKVLGSVPDAGPKSRPQVAAALKRAADFRQKIPSETDLRELTSGSAPLPELLARSQALLELLGRLKDFLPTLRTAHTTLERLNPASRKAFDPQAKRDDQDLEELTKFRDSLTQAAKKIALALTQSDAFLASPEGLAAQVQGVRAGAVLSPEDAERRRKKLTNGLDAVSQAAALFARQPPAQADENLAALQGIQDGLNQYRLEAMREGQALKRLAEAVQADKASKREDKAILARLQDLQKDCDECVAQVDRIHRELGVQYVGAVEKAKEAHAEAAALVAAARKLAQPALAKVEEVVQQYAAANDAFRAVARKPRANEEARTAYAQATAAYLARLDQLEKEAVRVRTEVGQLQAEFAKTAVEVQKLMKRFSPVALNGQPDTAAELQKGLSVLSLAPTGVQMILTRIASDRQAYGGTKDEDVEAPSKPEPALRRAS